MTVVTDDGERKQAFLALFVRHLASIEAFVHAAVRERSAADDLVQEIAIALWASFDSYDANRSFAAWAKGVASHILISYYRKSAQITRMLSPATLEVLAAATDDEGIDQTAEIAALRQCVERLPGRARRLLTLRYEQGMTLAQIGVEAGIGAEGVRKSLARLRMALKACVHKRMLAWGDA
jgi:RNA polymerase sigma-70 factor (ECF subfamily)